MLGNRPSAKPASGTLPPTTHRTFQLSSEPSSHTLLDEYGFSPRVREPFSPVASGEGPDAVTARVTDEGTLALTKGNQSFTVGLPEPVADPFSYTVSKNGKVVAIASAHTVAIGRLSWSETGLKVEWNEIRTASRLARAFTSPRPISRIALNEDGSLVATGHMSGSLTQFMQPSAMDGSIRVYDTTSGKEQHTFSVDGMREMEFKQGRLFYSLENGLTHSRALGS